ncbi:23S rRNA (guanosine2251-2'-O)-methyltransferase [Haloechinothrix alba]|uniref:23S rRNA (Guanosine2251-2'-O)-methyltransferase n=1 Tax=Haloechinothrix alba TaxID=664784 RepID=A0A238VEB2_9PSEU|nr:RNA methyltransferase [Haloechinothrix alba]SNR31869.1 23S rRNA (guanosine2251-2'-O)-methyltransferase [Haloechinothrix alba]
MVTDSGSPKDRFITVYGRNPVLEVLTDDELAVDKVIIAESARGVQQIRRAAASRGVRVDTASAHRVKVLAGNGRQDQGVLADVVAPRMRPLAAALDAPDGPGRVLLVDGVTTPANLGMILRTATAAGIDGIVVPRRGVASLDPLVVKASAGVAFRAPVLRCATAAEAASALSGAGFELLALRAEHGRSLYETTLPPRAAFVLGGESAGISEPVRERVTGWLSIPMHGHVESLNVSAAAAVLCFEVARRDERVTHPRG